MAGMAWEKAELDEPAARASITAELGRINDALEHGCLFHDPAWLFEAEGRSIRDVAVYICRRNREAIGYAPFVIQKWALRFLLGEITLFSADLERLHLHRGPVNPTNGLAATELAISLLALIRPTLKPRQVVYLEGVRHEGPLERALADGRLAKIYSVVQMGALYERRLIMLPDNFETYLQSLSRHTRQNLRTGYRKLVNHIGTDPKLLTFTTAADMSDFVSRAAAISKKTYQWHLLGLGLRKPEQLERTLIAMARRGWTKCYLLECGSIATAFMIGYQYQGTYWYVDVGFDPDWGKWSVGTMLHLAVLRELVASGNRPQWFDFSSGTGPQKERFSNRSRAEANFLLVPKSLRGLLLIWAYEGMTILSDHAVRLLDKLKLKATVKRIVRRFSTRKAAAE
jgi:hypothetical protein